MALVGVISTESGQAVYSLNEPANSIAGSTMQEKILSGNHKINRKKVTCVYEVMNSDVVQLGQWLGNSIAVGWMGNVHTSDRPKRSKVGSLPRHPIL